MDKFIKSRPQRLCLMCGKCCRVVTAPFTYKEMTELANNGHEGAKDFLSIFEPYPSIEAAREVHPEVVDNILINLENTNNSLEEVTFYKCRYLLDNNLCNRYKNRLELCERFPSSAWAVIPPGCGYEGWLFQYREELKQKIRKQKESLLELEIELNKDHTPEMKLNIEVTIQNIKNTIKAYSKYGSEHW